MLMVIIGISGKMGNQIYEKYKSEFQIIGIDILKHPLAKTVEKIQDIHEKIDVIVDFSSPETYEIIVQAIQFKILVLSGTTGYTFEQIASLKQLAKQYNTKFIWEANYAKGIKLFTKLVSNCKKEFHILDFIEIHETSKKDSPSGTAKVLAKNLGISEQKIQSLRLNQAPAIHEIIFSSENERVFIRHEIINKKAFIIGFDEELKKNLRS